MYILKKLNNHPIRADYIHKENLYIWHLQVKLNSDNKIHILSMRTSYIATGYDIVAKDQYDEMFFVKLNKTTIDVSKIEEDGNIVFNGFSNIVICDANI